jgi:hypothetical protein
MLCRFVIVLFFLVVCTELGAGSAFAERFRTSIPWKNIQLQIQFVEALNKDNRREYFSGPFGVFLGSADRVYVADDLAHRVLVFDKHRQLVQTIGKKGSQAGDFAWLDGITVDSEGKLYVADTGNDRIQVLDRTGRAIKHLVSGEKKRRDFSRIPEGLR